MNEMTYSIGNGMNSEYFSINALNATSSRYWSLSSFKWSTIRVPVVSIGSDYAETSAAIVYWSKDSDKASQRNCTPSEPFVITVILSATKNPE